MRNLKIRMIVPREKPLYDRHRRIRKRITIGGWFMGKYLPPIKKTWGQYFIARRRGQELAKFFSKPDVE